MFRGCLTFIMRVLGTLVQQISAPIVKFCAIAEFHMVLLATLVPPKATVLFCFFMGLSYSTR